MGVTECRPTGTATPYGSGIIVRQEMSNSERGNGRASGTYNDFDEIARGQYADARLIIIQNRKGAVGFLL